MASLLELYLSFSTDKEEDILRIDSRDNAGPSHLSIVAGDRNTTALKIWSTILDAFLYDEKHGLDKNLSAEVRHGFFENLMRSKLEANHLLAEIDEEGCYRESRHWAEINGLLVPEVQAKINADIAWFTAEINSLIEEAEEWMKITQIPEDTVRIFNYKVHTGILSSVRATADRGNVEELIEFCMGLCWALTEEHLSSMREAIDGKFRDRVDQIFTGLVDRLNISRGEAAVTEMMFAVKRAKNDVREDISAVAGWFRRADVSTEQRSVDDLLAISVECFGRIRKCERSPKLVIGPGTGNVLMAGRNKKNFVVALINLYENCIKHSGLGLGASIEIITVRDGDSWSITVSNSLTDIVKFSLAKRMDGIRGKLDKDMHAGLVTTEGGTGLRKVVNQLSVISPKFAVQVGMANNKFEARISYVSENTVGGR